MAPTGADRRQLLTAVREGLADAVREPLGERGFEFKRRYATFGRVRGGVLLEFRLGISSRPPSLGGVGILVQPMMIGVVPAWVEEARRRLASASGPLLHWEHPEAAVISEALNGLMPGKRAAWMTLPDEPSQSEVAEAGRLLRDSLITFGLPFLEQVSSKEKLLEIAASGEMRVMHEARFGVACGAMLAERPDLARLIIAPYGTARRESVAGVLGLPG